MSEIVLEDRGGSGSVSPSADDPLVILNLLRARGLRFEGMATDKLVRRIRLSVRMNYISERQADLLRTHLRV
jgi:hypothetical protein